MEIFAVKKCQKIVSVSSYDIGDVMWFNGYILIVCHTMYCWPYVRQMQYICRLLSCAVVFIVRKGLENVLTNEQDWTTTTAGKKQLKC